MKYSKPELTVMGDASSMILGDKNRLAEPADLTKQQASAFEMED